MPRCWRDSEPVVCGRLAYVDASDERDRLAARPLARERSRLFDQQAEAYDRFRPTYPDAVIDELLGPVPAGLDVLDVGCGTGIASRQIAQRGAKVLGVELAPRMAGSRWTGGQPHHDTVPAVGAGSLGARSPVVGIHVVGVQTVEEFPDRPLGSEHVKGPHAARLRNDLVLALRLCGACARSARQVATHRGTAARPDSRTLRAIRRAFGSHAGTRVLRTATRTCREKQRCLRVRDGDRVSRGSCRRRSTRRRRAPRTPSRATRSPTVQPSRASRTGGRDE